MWLRFFYYYATSPLHSIPSVWRPGVISVVPAGLPWLHVYTWAKLTPQVDYEASSPSFPAPQQGAWALSTSFSTLASGWPCLPLLQKHSLPWPYSTQILVWKLSILKLPLDVSDSSTMCWFMARPSLHWECLALPLYTTKNNGDI